MFFFIKDEGSQVLAYMHQINLKLDLVAKKSDEQHKQVMQMISELRKQSSIGQRQTAAGAGEPENRRTPAVPVAMNRPGGKALDNLSQALRLRDELLAESSIKFPLKSRRDVIKAHDILSSNSYLQTKVSEFLFQVVDDARTSMMGKTPQVKRLLAAALFNRFTAPFWLVWGYRGGDKPSAEEFEKEKKETGNIFDDQTEVFNPPEFVLQTQYKLNMKCFDMHFVNIYVKAWNMCFEKQFVEKKT